MLIEKKKKRGICYLYEEKLPQNKFFLKGKIFPVTGIN